MELSTVEQGVRNNIVTEVMKILKKRSIKDLSANEVKEMKKQNHTSQLPLISRTDRRNSILWVVESVLFSGITGKSKRIGPRKISGKYSDDVVDIWVGTEVDPDNKVKAIEERTDELMMTVKGAAPVRPTDDDDGSGQGGSDGGDDDDDDGDDSGDGAEGGDDGLDALTVDQLKGIASDLEIPQISRMAKATLIEKIRAKRAEITTEDEDTEGSE